MSPFYGTTALVTVTKKVRYPIRYRDRTVRNKIWTLYLNCSPYFSHLRDTLSSYNSVDNLAPVYLNKFRKIPKRQALVQMSSSWLPPWVSAYLKKDANLEPVFRVSRWIRNHQLKVKFIYFFLYKFGLFLGGNIGHTVIAFVGVGNGTY